MAPCRKCIAGVRIAVEGQSGCSACCHEGSFESWVAFVETDAATAAAQAFRFRSSPGPTVRNAADCQNVRRDGG